MRLRELQLVDTNGWTCSEPILEGTRVAHLADRVNEVVALSGWWNTAEALSFITCGYIPPAAVRVTTTQKADGRTEVALKVVAPTTTKELAEVYQRTLDRHRLNPKPLSSTQHAVLELFHDTPSLSWPERYRRWLELCDERPGLPRLSGPDSLAKTYRDALKRAAWGEGKPRKVTP
jgi:hypothetical protein